MKLEVNEVNEVKGWGCIAFCRLMDGAAYIRLEEDAYVKVGRLHWSNHEDEESNT